MLKYLAAAAVGIFVAGPLCGAAFIVLLFVFSNMNTPDNNQK